MNAPTTPAKPRTTVHIITSCQGESCQQGRRACTTPQACQLPTDDESDWKPLTRGEALRLWAAVLAVPAGVITLALANALWSYPA